MPQRDQGMASSIPSWMNYYAMPRAFPFSPIQRKWNPHSETPLETEISACTSTTFFSFMSLDFNSLCTVASFLKLKDFKAFLSTCQAWSLCRHDARTVAQVYVRTFGDNAPIKAAQWGCPIVRFFARQFPDTIIEMARCSLIYGKDDASALLKPFVPDEMVPDLARRVIRESPNTLAILLKHWDIDEKTRRDLMELIDREGFYDDDDYGTLADKII
jgi:hypothetical protein